MFILIALMFVAVGILLFFKSTKMPQNQGPYMIVKIASIGLILLGIILTVFLIWGKIELPLSQIG